MDCSSGAQPWSTDGTTAGTVRLGALATGSNPQFLGVVGAQLAGTHAVTNPAGINGLYNPHGFALVGTLVLYASDGLLWSIDTTTDTIVAVTATGGTVDFGPPQVDEILNPVAMNGFVLFLASGSASDRLPKTRLK
jgi:ELWxxDGT repeat protein